MPFENQMSREPFTETQQFRQPWIWAIFAICVGIQIYSRNFPGACFVLAMVSLFWYIKLVTRIDDRGISFRWVPFQFSEKRYKWSDIEAVQVRRYAPLAEFGGWGFRLGFRGTAHTTSGKEGIEIRLKGQSRFIMLGTHKAEEARRYLENAI